MNIRKTHELLVKTQQSAVILSTHEYFKILEEPYINLTVKEASCSNVLLLYITYYYIYMYAYTTLSIYCSVISYMQLNKIQ